MGLDNVIRFRENMIVSYLQNNGSTDMNALAAMDFSNEDRAQFAQLIGFSVSGWGELSYVDDSEADIAAEIAAGLITTPRQPIKEGE